MAEKLECELMFDLKMILAYMVYIYKSDTYNVILPKRLVYNIEVQIFNQFYFPIFRKMYHN